jgi:RHS repeat-associated protein
MISGFTFMTLSAACAKEHVQILSRSTGKERDTESGNDYFGARYYNSSMGRFMSPDWRVAHSDFLESCSSHKGGCPILSRCRRGDRKGGLPRTSTVGLGVEFFRDGETCPLPAMRLFSLSDLQLLSQAGAVDA